MTEYETGITNRVLWCVAIADEPVTALEIRDRLGERRQSVSTSLLRLYKAELVIRRKTDNGEPGPSPYEYRLNPDYEP